MARLERVVEDPGGGDPHEAVLAQPQAITLKLVLGNSLLPQELGEYDALSGEEVRALAEGLKTLHLEWQRIAEIANLEAFDSAEVLYLQYNRIERIENLEPMPKLQFLALQHNQISAVENLACLRELQFLDLRGNLIEELDVAQLPKSINELNLADNPCVTKAGYPGKVLAHLTDLAALDGEDLDDPAEGSLTRGLASVASSPLPPAGEDVKGLSAYWQRGDMQRSVTDDMAQQIQAYSVEADADVEGFSSQVEDAVRRSRGRRKGMEKCAETASRSLDEATLRSQLFALKRAPGPEDDVLE